MEMKSCLKYGFWHELWLNANFYTAESEMLKIYLECQNLYIQSVSIISLFNLLEFNQLFDWEKKHSHKKPPTHKTPIYLKKPFGFVVLWTCFFIFVKNLNFKLKLKFSRRKIKNKIESSSNLVQVLIHAN